MTFRREKYVDRGGPDGGNGGKGGDVYLRVEPSLSSLLDLTYRPHYYAEDGSPGMGSNKAGRGGKDLIVHVPVGTVVLRDQHVIADLKQPGELLLIAKGGRSGRGNSAFKTSRNTAPMISEKGEPGEMLLIDLELKLLADVGLIGCPNAGKSTLLARLTSARPKIADYPFTTLNPNLGVAEWHGTRFVLADIPGLIEGAHAGRGLGHDFLRHVERTRLLFHLVDASGFDGKDPVKNVRMLNQELQLFSPKLMKKPMVIVLNKMDITGAEKTLTTMKKHFKKLKITPISAVTGEGVDRLLAFAAKELSKPVIEDTAAAPVEPFHFMVELDYVVEPKGEEFLVRGTKIERLAAMTNFGQQEGVKRFQNILKKMGVEKELARKGARPGDTVRIGKLELTYEP